MAFPYVRKFFLGENEKILGDAWGPKIRWEQLTARKKKNKKKGGGEKIKNKVGIKSQPSLRELRSNPQHNSEVKIE